MVATPDTGDSSFWATVIAGLGAIGGLVAWLYRRIEAVRTEAADATADGDDALREALDKLRTELAASLTCHRREFAESQREAAKFREYVVGTMATRNDMERAIDKQTEQLLSRLDARFAPMQGRGP